MGTTIVNPGQGANPMSEIDNAFSSVYSMFGSPSGAQPGGGTGPFGITPQPVSGSDNSLTAYFRGLSNLLGGGGATALSGGGGLIGTGTGIMQGGLDIAGTGLPMIGAGMGTMGTGLGTTGTGLETLQPSIDFYKKILSGDPTATTAALAPTAANIAQITSGATDQASRGMPGGGYRAATLAGLPFAQAAQVGNAALALQPAAAQALGTLGGEQAQIGQEQAQIGQEQVGAGTAAGNLGVNIAQEGLGLGQLGTNLTSQGFSALQNAVADMLEKMGVNIKGGITNTFNTWTQSLQNLI